MPPLLPRPPTTLKEVAEMMELLKEFKHNLETRGSLRPINGGLPFNATVLTEVLPVGARLPHLKPYNGSIDIDNHLYYFLNTMWLHNFNDAILCKTFTTTLKGVVRIML